MASDPVTTYYLSGPMRGKTDYNRETFNAVETAFLANATPYENARVLNPAKNFDGDTTREPTEYLNLDFQQVLSSDAVILLPGWQASEGALREVQLALWAGKRFVTATLAESLVAGYEPKWFFDEIDGPEFSESVRAQACDEAKQLITGDRNNSYGPPWQDFQRTAGALNAYGYRGPDGRLLESHDVAIMVDCVKTSRLMWTPAKRDSWVDKIGYAACGLECALHDAEVKREET